MTESLLHAAGRQHGRAGEHGKLAQMGNGLPLLPELRHGAAEGMVGGPNYSMPPNCNLVNSVCVAAHKTGCPAHASGFFPDHDSCISSCSYRSRHRFSARSLRSTHQRRNCRDLSVGALRKGSHVACGFPEQTYFNGECTPCASRDIPAQGIRMFNSSTAVGGQLRGGPCLAVHARATRGMVWCYGAGSTKKKKGVRDATRKALDHLITHLHERGKKNSGVAGVLLMWRLFSSFSCFASICRAVCVRE